MQLAKELLVTLALGPVAGGEEEIGPPVPALLVSVDARGRLLLRVLRVVSVLGRLGFRQAE
jgi:hypothetical protein